MRFDLTAVPAALLVATLTLAAGACGNSSAGDESAARSKADGGERSGRPGSGGAGGLGGPPAQSTAVPVEVATVERRAISFYIQSNGTLEAENEVDLVARTSGPIRELRTEEGRFVSKGQLLARIDDDEIRSQVEISRVALDEARLNFERAQELFETQLLSPEAYDQTKSRLETAQAQHQRNQVQLGYTEIRAPFSGLIIARYIDAAQQVAVGTPLFRLSDFDPLLCPVQIPERELRRLGVGQDAYLTVEAWGDDRFEAKVLRVSPVIEARTGTVKVTLDVRGEGKLRPGMFARVFLETETHDAAVVVPKNALSLESLGDTIFVYSDGVAKRREVELGFEEGDLVEVVAGVSPGERVVVVGQDGLSDGTPIEILQSLASPGAGADAGVAAAAGGPGDSATEPWAGPRPDPSSMTPQDIERMKERMRARGLSEAEIDERVETMRQGGRDGAGARSAPPTQ